MRQGVYVSIRRVAADIMYCAAHNTITASRQHHTNSTEQESKDDENKEPGGES
jgi:hypothetical protein